MLREGRGSEKTVASRFAAGLVSEYDSFKFTSTIYHSVTHVIMSLDEWIRVSGAWHVKQNKLFFILPLVDSGEKNVLKKKKKSTLGGAGVPMRRTSPDLGVQICTGKPGGKQILALQQSGRRRERKRSGKRRLNRKRKRIFHFFFLNTNHDVKTELCRNITAGGTISITLSFACFSHPKNMKTKPN